jgi:hypothetical protein
VNLPLISESPPKYIGVEWIKGGQLPCQTCVDPHRILREKNAHFADADLEHLGSVNDLEPDYIHASSTTTCVHVCEQISNTEVGKPFCLDAHQVHTGVILLNLCGLRCVRKAVCCDRCA